LPSGGWFPDHVVYEEGDDEATKQAREVLAWQEKEAADKFIKEQETAKKNRDHEARLRHMEANLAIEKLKAIKRPAEQSVPVQQQAPKKFMGLFPLPSIHFH